MKKWGAILFFIFSLMLTTKWLVQYRQHETNTIAEKQDFVWKGYVKKTSQSKPHLIKEISKEDKKYLPATPKKSRRPSSQSQTKTPPLKKKKIIGKRDALDQELMLINDPRSDWQEILVERMLNTQSPNTKMFVQHKGQALIVRSAQARAVEEVLITFKKEDKSISSYMAWVDSETGSVVRTWARTHNHNFRNKSPGLTPSGTL